MSLLRQDGGLPEASVHDFARDLATALQYLHSNCILYCDLKPSNVLLNENGRIKLGGFGLSRRLSNTGQAQAVPQVLLFLSRARPPYVAQCLTRPLCRRGGARHVTWRLSCFRTKGRRAQRQTCGPWAASFMSARPANLRLWTPPFRAWSIASCTRSPRPSPPACLCLDVREVKIQIT